MTWGRQGRCYETALVSCCRAEPLYTSKRRPWITTCGCESVREGRALDFGRIGSRSPATRISRLRVIPLGHWPTRSEEQPPRRASTGVGRQVSGRRAPITEYPPARWPYAEWLGRRILLAGAS